jgi:hypothetical protein
VQFAGLTDPEKQPTDYTSKRSSGLPQTEAPHLLEKVLAGDGEAAGGLGEITARLLEGRLDGLALGVLKNL